MFIGSLFPTSLYFGSWWVPGACLLQMSQVRWIHWLVFRLIRLTRRNNYSNFYLLKFHKRRKHFEWELNIFKLYFACKIIEPYWTIFLVLACHIHHKKLITSWRNYCIIFKNFLSIGEIKYLVSFLKTWNSWYVFHMIWFRILCRCGLNDFCTILRVFALNTHVRV